MKADLIREKRKLIRNEARMRKSLKNRAVIPRPSQSKKLSVMEDHLDSLGFDTTTISARARSQSRGRSTLRSRAETEDAMDVDTPTSNVDALRAKSRARSQSNRREDGVTSVGARNKAERLAKLGQKKMNRMARQGEADRHTTAALPKHLVSLLSIKVGGLRLLMNFSSRENVGWGRRNDVDWFLDCISEGGVLLVGVLPGHDRWRYEKLNGQLFESCCLVHGCSLLNCGCGGIVLV